MRCKHAPDGGGMRCKHTTEWPISHTVGRDHPKAEVQMDAKRRAEDEAHVIHWPEPALILLTLVFSCGCRAYDSDIAGGSGGLEQRVLIPLMDSLNHAGSRGPSVTFDCTNSVGGEEDIRKRRIPVGVAAREGGVQAGEELLSYYGAKPNWNFLTSYGFVSDESVSQETTLTASLDASDGLFSAKREALARLGLASEDQLFDIQASKPPSPKVRFTPFAVDPPRQCLLSCSFSSPISFIASF